MVILIVRIELSSQFIFLTDCTKPTHPLNGQIPLSVTKVFCRCSHTYCRFLLGNFYRQNFFPKVNRKWIFEIVLDTAYTCRDFLLHYRIVEYLKSKIPQHRYCKDKHGILKNCSGVGFIRRVVQISYVASYIYENRTYNCS